MTVTKSGIRFEDITNGLYKYGDDNAGTTGVGSLTVDGSSLFDMTATALDDDENLLLDVGEGAGSNGTVTVTGAGSKITLQPAAGDTDGTQITVAIGTNGGTGTLNVLAGATFEIVDNSTTAIIDPDYVGSDNVAIGDQGSGHLTVDASTFSITGGAPGFALGRDGGTGEALFDHGAAFTMQSVTDNDVQNPDIWWQTSEPYLSVGRQNGAVGVLTFDHVSTGTMTSGTNSGATVDVGRDTGTGTFNLLGGSTFTMNGDAFADVIIGRSGGNGFLNIVGASHLNMNGVTEAATLRIGAFDGNGNRNGGGTGIATVTDFFVALTSDGYAHIIVGNRADGTLEVDNSTVTMAGAGFNGLDVGVEGGTGFVSLENSAVVTATSSNRVEMAVGRGGTLDAPSFGRVDVDDADINLTGTGTASAGAVVGSESGLGVLNLKNGHLSITSEAYTYVNFGFHEASALVDISAGSVVSMTSTNTDGVSALIGAYHGGAIVTLRGGSTWNFASVIGGDLTIGSDWMADGTDSGTGTFNVQGGSHINFGASGVDANYNLRVGGGDGSKAKLVVSGGSVVDLDTAGGSDSWGGLQIANRGADSATVLVDGNGSKVDHVDYLQIGFDPTDAGSVAGGQGTLTIKNGAVVIADLTRVGAGGALGGYRGTLNGDVELNGGGRIDLRDGLFGSFTMNGDVITTNAGNALAIDVGSGGRQDTLTFDSFNNSAGQLAITLNAVGGYQFLANETRAIVDLPGNLPTFSVAGQNANFGFYGGHLASDPDNSVYVRALNAGNSVLTSLATLDFGTGGPLATVIYNAVTGNGTVKGGIYGAIGGRAYNIDKFALTDLADTVTITGATARAFSYDGRGGIDTINGGFGVDNVLGGVGNDVLKGNSGNDILNGGNDSDQLFGGLGNDTLTGGLGNDFFVFNTALNALANKDTVLDFANVANNNDTFRLENAIFTKLAAVGALNPAFFRAGAAALDANDYIVYDKASGALFYDVNGNGAGGAIQFATLLNKPTLTASDFQVI